MRIEMTSDEAFFLEKLCDDQQSMINGRIHKIAENWLFLNTKKDEDEGDKILKGLLIKSFNEYARTTKILDNLRAKFEEARK